MEIPHVGCRVGLIDCGVYREGFVFARSAESETPLSIVVPHIDGVYRRSDDDVIIVSSKFIA